MRCVVYITCYMYMYMYIHVCNCYTFYNVHVHVHEFLFMNRTSLRRMWRESKPLCCSATATSRSTPLPSELCACSVHCTCMYMYMYIHVYIHKCTHTCTYRLTLRPRAVLISTSGIFPVYLLKPWVNLFVARATPIGQLHVTSKEFITH